MDEFRFRNKRNVQLAVLSLRAQAEGREADKTKYPDQEGQKAWKGKDKVLQARRLERT